MTSLNHDPDVALVERRIASRPDSRSVAEFVPGPGIERLSLSFDIEALREPWRNACAGLISWAACRMRDRRSAADTAAGTDGMDERPVGTLLAAATTAMSRRRARISFRKRRSANSIRILPAPISRRFTASWQTAFRSAG